MNTVKPTDNVINPYTNKTPNKPAKKPEAQTDKAAVKTVKDRPAAKDSGVYTKKSAHKEKLEKVAPKINLILQKNAEQLIQMVYDILSAQGRQGAVAARKLENAIFSLKDYIEGGGEISAEDQAAAAAAIADDGPWGVEAVSDRLVAMAVKLAGGDESKYKMLKSAIEAGFKTAEAMWGGQLPEISYKTFDATMTKLAAAFGQTAAEPAEGAEAG